MPKTRKFKIGDTVIRCAPDSNANTGYYPNGHVDTITWVNLNGAQFRVAGEPQICIARFWQLVKPSKSGLYSDKVNEKLVASALDWKKNV